MKTLLIFLFALLSLNAISQEKRIFYVSSSTGNDSNRGTIEAPKKSIKSVIGKNKNNIELRLCRGDVFFENISGLKNSIISAYGEGAKPIICGFKVLKDVNQWSFNVSKRCWVLDLNNTSSFVGFPTNPKDSIKVWNNIGCIYVPNVDTIIGHIVKSETLLKNDGDLFVDSTYQKSYLNSNSYRFLCYIGPDPRKLGNICLSIRSHGISNMTNCVIQDVAIMGFGMHGFCALNNCHISNLRLDVIGGAVQIGYKKWARFGNGVEFGPSSHDNLVEKSVITRTYDCGSTIQGSGNITNSPRNIFFTNNVYYHCRQAFEHFLNSQDTVLVYDNCHFTHNVCIDNGYNDFDTPELRDAQILSYEKVPKPIDISQNTFFGSNYFCGVLKPEGMVKNKVYIYSEQYLRNSYSKSEKKIFAKSKKHVLDYYSWSSDNSDFEILEKGSKKSISIRSRLLKDIDLSTPNLHLERIL